MHERVHMGRLDTRVAVRAERAMCLLICEDDKDVWLVWHGSHNEGGLVKCLEKQETTRKIPKKLLSSK